ncbi:MAG: transposase, partial [Candidatus Competibacteraceae bacterium]|nr:transposase [Candidatus Competibacteraceae bacterium]
LYGVGYIVVLDNLGSHKVQGVREAIEAAGAKLLYLPPYSPDLDPIEQVFPNSKAGARSRNALSLPFGTPSAMLFPFSPQWNAQTTSLTQVMRKPFRFLL